ncbi:MAG: hypothetical protein HOI67_00645, partial [Gammaproteobacteria bacterium]|nr:hypothetical protein [Gammaproteobacteria bacterium]
MQKFTIYTLSIVICLTGFYSALDFLEGILKQNDLSISVDDRRRVGADNIEAMGRDGESDPIMARFLWEDEPSKQDVEKADVALSPNVVLDPNVVVDPDAEQRVARFLWRDASPIPSASPDRLELQWSEQGTL